MTAAQNTLPKWILLVSGVIALLEIMVSILLIYSPQSVAETVDLSAKGVEYIIYMWAARQFALGFIMAYAAFRKSIPMLTLAFIFLLVMFVGDLIIGISQKESSMILSAVVMCMVSSAMIFTLNKRS